MVHLTRIYTRTGDLGQTRLADMSVASKTSARVEAYGAVDEANAAIGVLAAQPGIPEEVALVLARVQNGLFDLGADLATPLPQERETVRIRAEQVERLEHWIDEFNDALPDLESFALPGGTPNAAFAHVARTVARRAERRAWALDLEEPGSVNPDALRYLNRLSDLLFTLARVLA
ncbi:MAG: cob(I)yrinic acid a,c-diamide adenosyltransferase, partial [Propionibacteriaceae bacterium]|nr:cob(I)yrinic acid a,c-diamide adenosyltransferase [Propionibacteriaceae bacterium]